VRRSCPTQTTCQGLQLTFHYCRSKIAKTRASGRAARRVAAAQRVNSAHSGARPCLWRRSPPVCGRHQEFPAARQQMPESTRNTAEPASRRPPTLWVEGSWHGRLRSFASTIDWVSNCSSLRRRCPVRRRLHNGGISGEGASLAGNLARQPVLDLRQQPHHQREEIV
jgi:hypothetical protein